MQVKVDILEGLQRKITVEIPTEEVNEKVLSRLKKVQKSVKMDGFRSGKVPMNVVKQKYEGSVRQEVLGDLIESSYGDAIKSEKLTPAAQPQIAPISGFAENEPFIYEATIEVVPEFEVKGLDSLTIKKPVAKVLAKDIKNMIDTLRKQKATWKDTADASAEGDRVLIDFVGKINGEVFEGGSAENMPVVLGAKQMLPEFEDALYGKKADDNVDIKINFPDSYRGKELSGKEADFSISVVKVEAPKLPKVDEAFIKEFGIADGSKETLETAISENMQRELDAGIRRIINQQVMQHLVDSNQVVIPEGMVAQEKERMAQESGLKDQVADESEQEKIKNENYDQPARRRVLLGLVMGKLFETQKIIPDGKRVEEHIEKVASTYEKPEEVRAHYKKNPDAVEQVYAQVMEDQLVESLLENAEIVEEKKSFDEIINGGVAG